MRKRPVEFSLAILGLLGIILFYPLSALWQGSWNLGLIPPLGWLMMGLSGLCVALLYQASSLLKYLGPLTALMIIICSATIMKFEEHYAGTATASMAAIALISMSSLMSSSARAVLLNPGQRWWRTPRRYRREVSTAFMPLVGETIQAKTFDLSKTGAFIDLSACVGGEKQECFVKVGETIRLSLSLGTMSKWRCDAVIVRKENAQGIYPSGIGVKFVDMGKDECRQLSRFLVTEKSEAAPSG